MADRQFSHTLPKDFIFFPPNEPRTPNRPAREPIMPPRPGHSTHRIRRRRLERKPIPFSAPDIPVPSIELPLEIEAPVAEEWQTLTESNSIRHLEVPPRERIDPKTPPAQIYEALEKESSDWADEFSTPIGSSINRPSSSCSNASDSSVSSSGSYASGPSYGGSCTSPETEIGDPFLDVSLPNNKDNLETPSKIRHLAPDIQISHRWATEMDNHLWDTYQSYLQDPTITPFKMLPGSLPPLGISHRVAREARKSWLRFKQKGSGDREAENQELGTKQTWPRSDSATRRRLKELCKRKYSIAPHYQRLLMSSSPSPPPEFLAHAYSGMSTRPESSGSNTVPFSRDLGVSLVSETLPGSLPEGDIGNQVISSSSPAALGSTASHQTTSSLAITRPRDRMSSDRSYDPAPRLGSPFMYYTWGPSNSRRRIRSITPVTPHDTIHVTGSRLRSAMPPDLFSSPHKKRIVEDKSRPIEDPFVDQETNPNQRRVRFRNRGVTISTSGSRDRLAQLFTPPSQSGSNASDNPPPSHTLDRIDLATPEGIKRLGSPFALDRPAVRPRQYPRHAPSRSEPFILSGAQKWISPLLPNHNQRTGEITPNTVGETEPSEVENTPPVKQASPLP